MKGDYTVIQVRGSNGKSEVFWFGIWFILFGFFLFYFIKNKFSKIHWYYLDVM